MWSLEKPRDPPPLKLKRERLISKSHADDKLKGSRWLCWKAITLGFLRKGTPYKELHREKPGSEAVSDRTHHKHISLKRVKKKRGEKEIGERRLEMVRSVPEE